MLGDDLVPGRGHNDGSVAGSRRLTILDDGDQVEFLCKKISLHRVRPEIHGNGCRSQHPERDHYHEGLRIIANTNADICSA